MSEDYEITPEKIRNTAVHEAGHAALALYLNRKVSGMTVQPSRRLEDGAILRGFCLVDERAEGDQGDHGFFAHEEDLIIAKGAMMAEVAFGIPPHKPALLNDLPPVATKRMLEAFQNDAKKFWERMDELNKITFDLVQMIEIQKAIREIAQVCIDRFVARRASGKIEILDLVTGDEVKAAYDRAIRGDFRFAKDM